MPYITFCVVRNQEIRQQCCVLQLWWTDLDHFRRNWTYVCLPTKGNIHWIHDHLPSPRAYDKSSRHHEARRLAWSEPDPNNIESKCTRQPTPPPTALLSAVTSTTLKKSLRKNYNAVYIWLFALEQLDPSTMIEIGNLVAPQSHKWENKCRI